MLSVSHTHTNRWRVLYSHRWIQLIKCIKLQSATYTWFMGGCCHADFPSVSQQHETSHRIEQYHIILIGEMCWKAISSSNKWAIAQQKPEECHLFLQRLCHEKSFILNRLTPQTHSKGSWVERGAFLRWQQGTGTEKKGLQERERGTLKGKGVLGSH